MRNSLVVSEMFFSIQGEGATAGRPAVFLRLAACNLNCPGFSYKAPGTQEHLGCDTKLVWKQGKASSFEQILQEWQQKNWLDKLYGGAHLVITGGEPLLQQEKIVEFIKLLDALIEPRVYIEIETNATIVPNLFLQERVNQFNVSPKLVSSGESRDKAYHLDCLKTFAALPKACFKFVVQTKADVAEIKTDYQTILDLATTRIWLMPEGGTLKTMQSNLQTVAELCIENNFNFSPRLHIHIWDEATGK
jgi:6-pyruvoyltetrahydropterin 2'-reductase